MWKSWTSVALLLAATSEVRAVDRAVGVAAPSGGASLVKQVHVVARTEIAGVEIVSNDLETVFPAVRLRRLDRRAAGEILSEVRDVSANNGSRHRFTVSIPPIVFSDDEDILVEVVLPPTPGVEAIGTGAGLGANDLAGSPATSSIGNTATGELQAIDADLCLSLVGPAPAGKSGPSSSPSQSLETGSAILSLEVRAPLGGDAEIAVTTASSVEVAVDIYDVRGTLVRTLAREEPAAGRHLLGWDRRDAAGHRVAAGVYFIVARVRALEVIRKAVILH